MEQWRKDAHSEAIIKYTSMNLKKLANWSWNRLYGDEMKETDNRSLSPVEN